MTGVQGWLWKYYTKENPDSAKCNHCGKVYSNCDPIEDISYHLYNVHNITELDEHPERDKIQQNYRISRLIAECKHCKKTINLATHCVHILIIHLNRFHSERRKKETTTRSRIWDKFVVTGNKATCKRCKKTIKKLNNQTSHLIRHSRYCQSHLKMGNSEKYNLNKTEKRSLWGNYDVTDGNARCKICKKTIKINCRRPTMDLERHLLLCRRKYKLKKVRKELRICDKYDITDSATCKGCGNMISLNVKNLISEMKQHLHVCWFYSATEVYNTDEDFSKVLSDSKAKAIISDQRRERASVLDKNAPSTSRPSGNDGFRSTMQSQRGIRQSSFKKKQKRKILLGCSESLLGKPLERKASTIILHGSYSSSSSESDEDLREALMKSKAEMIISNYKQKRTAVVDENAPSTARSTGVEGFHGTMQSPNGSLKRITQSSSKMK